MTSEKSRMKPERTGLARRDAPSGRARDPQGKVALFSGAPRRDGPFIVECSGCGSHTRIGLRGLALHALPMNFTIPLKYHHTWMRCPACGNLRWVRIRKFG